MKKSRSSKAIQTAGASALLLLLAAPMGFAQPGVFPPDLPPPPGALNTLTVPLPSNLADYVVDINAAKVLGKAFFWDQQAGSDGLACASCHFNAGADNRIKNTLDPGLRNTDPAKQNIWNLTASNRLLTKAPPPGGGPNYTMKKADFPFHQLSNIADRNSAVVFDTDDILSSQGVFRGDFHNVNVIGPNSGGQGQIFKAEICTQALSPTFSVGGVNTRQVEPRNTPTVINAIFNFRNFWDGRANNIFNGRNPFGPRDATAGIDPANSVLVADALGNLTPMYVSIPDASLASQAVGPPGSDLEMSCRGRIFEEIGKKLLQLQPLGLQKLDDTDSLLGPYSQHKFENKAFAGSNGLNVSYPSLIKKAFASQFWSSNKLSVDGYTQMQKNFSLFWGLSIMLYESTLVSDNSPFDQYMNGNILALTNQQAQGLQAFNGGGGCIFCHKGPEFTSAASSLKTNQALGALIEHMLMGDGTVAAYDSGWYNIGTRPTSDDIGVGGLDPWGNPLSFSRQAKNAVPANQFAINLLGVGPDNFNVFTCNFQVDPCFPLSQFERDAVDGSFKVPTLRNVELTGPYFHNGGQMTLAQVVDFYARGGDGAGTDFFNTTGFTNTNTGLLSGPVSYPTNRAPAILPLAITATDKANIVAFLKSLTDERVRWEMAPFDHPSLIVPNGHPGDENKVGKNGNTYAVDSTLAIPAVGAAGRAALKLPPIGPFDANLK